MDAYFLREDGWRGFIFWEIWSEETVLRFETIG